MDANLDHSGRLWDLPLPVVIEEMVERSGRDAYLLRSFS